MFDAPGDLSRVVLEICHCYPRPRSHRLVSKCFKPLSIIGRSFGAVQTDRDLCLGFGLNERMQSIVWMWFVLASAFFIFHVPVALSAWRTPLRVQVSILSGGCNRLPPILSARVGRQHVKARRHALGLNLRDLISS